MLTADHIIVNTNVMHYGMGAHNPVDFIPKLIPIVSLIFNTVPSNVTYVFQNPQGPILVTCPHWPPHHLPKSSSEYIPRSLSTFPLSIFPSPRTTLHFRIIMNTLATFKYLSDRSSNNGHPPPPTIRYLRLQEVREHHGQTAREVLARSRQEKTRPLTTVSVRMTVPQGCVPHPSPSLTATKKRGRVTNEDETPLKRKRGNGH